MKNKLIYLSLMAITFSIAGCGPNGGSPSSGKESISSSSQTTSSSLKPPIIDYSDKDFDGLYDDIDPNPNNNNYSFYLENWSSTKISNNMDITVDYRKLIHHSESELDADVGKMSSIMVLEEPSIYAHFIENSYSNSESRISPSLVQFGCTDLQFIEISKTECQYDIHDRANLIAGHHLFVDEGGAKYNVIMVDLFPYVDNTGWISNFDFGADSEGYTDFSGQHPEWDNKNGAKGFYITSKRIYQKILNYRDSVKQDGFEDFFFITGQSRGGAISSMVGAMLKDNNIKNLVYAYNSPNQISESDTSKLTSYKNIFSLVNADDFVHEIPLSSWNNFNHYGNVFTYEVSENVDMYNNFYTHKQYPSIDPAVKSDILSLISTWVGPSRGTCYEYRSTTPEECFDNQGQGFISSAVAEKEIEQIWDSFLENKELAKKVISMEIGEFSGDSSKFQINYKTKPAMVISILNLIFGNNGSSPVFPSISPFLKFLPRYLNEASSLLSLLISDIPGFINGIVCAHEQLQIIIGVQILTAK